MSVEERWPFPWRGGATPLLGLQRVCAAAGYGFQILGTLLFSRFRRESLKECEGSLAMSGLHL